MSMRIDPKNPAVRKLHGGNPFVDLNTSDLANRAGQLADELLAARPRTQAQRLALTESVAYMLIACNHRLHKMKESDATEASANTLTPSAALRS
jgi:hypothetical protein